MSLEEQTKYSCILGDNYPLPIVDHKEAVRMARDKISKVRKDDNYKSKSKNNKETRICGFDFHIFGYTNFYFYFSSASLNLRMTTKILQILFICFCKLHLLLKSLKMVGE